MKNPIFLILASLVVTVSHAEQRIMTLDELADVYYDAESGDPVVADEIKSLNGQTIRIAGYMVPFNQLENLKEFMLMPSSNGCNFCEAPMKEEMVYVKQPGKKKYPFITEPIVVTGKLWVKGAGTPPLNKTYAQFLYCLQDTKVTKLRPEDQALLSKVTPRTIIKQVCSLLRVRLLKQVTFVELDEVGFLEKRRSLLLEYLGGPEQAKALENFLTCFDVTGADTLVSSVSTYLAHWNAAFSDASGEKIYYKKGLDLSTQENQQQIAIACYDLLFHQEIDLHEKIHKGTPSIDETLARLSLILGLRQSFAQFYGSIGLIEMKPLKDFMTPYDSSASLPKAFSPLAEQLLVKQEAFISEVYKSQQYQPYTKAISAPPLSMEQILKPALYTKPKESEAYKAPSVEGHNQQRLGSYLAGLILKLSEEQKSHLIADGIDWTPQKFSWFLKFDDEETLLAVEQKLKTFGKTETSREKLELKIDSK